MRHLLAAVVVAFLVGLGVPVSPAAAQSLPGAAPNEQVPLIAPDALRNQMRAGKRLLLVDVRQPDEFAGGHIDGAVLMPLDRLPQTYRQIPKGVKLVVYCRSGHRSAKAVSFLRGHGYDKAVSLDGGYLAWTGANRP
jgi:phage shock protein E